MATAMNGMDTLIFTGGVGEHSREIRDNVCARLKSMASQVRGKAPVQIVASQFMQLPLTKNSSSLFTLLVS